MTSVKGEVVLPDHNSEMKKGATLSHVQVEETRGEGTHLCQLFPRVSKDVVGVLGLESVGTHRNCVENEESSLRSRVLMLTPVPSAAGKVWWRGASEEVAGIIRRCLGDLEPWSLPRTTRHMVKRHGAGRYAWAAESLQELSLGKGDGRVSLFVKVEKHLKTGGVLKEARAIQFRGPRFTLMLARFLVPFEERFCETFKQLNDTGLYTTKGLSPDLRATLLSTLWSRRRAPSALCIDASRFDAHVTPTMLSWEASVYTACFSRERGLLAWMLRRQLVNRGRTHWGLRYKVVGCRMSGDVNTSMGNTLIQLALLKAATAGFECDLVVEGDDALVFAESADICKLEKLISERAAGLGMVYKCSRAWSPEDLEYCSTRLVEVSPGLWRSVRKLEKALVTDVYTTRPVPSPTAAADKARVVAVCHASQMHGLPVFGAWAAYLLSHTLPAKKLDEWYDRGLWLVTRERLSQAVRDTGRVVTSGSYSGVPDLVFGSCGTVSDLARSSFYCAYGIAPSEQLRLEYALQLGMGPHPPVVTGAEVCQLVAGLD